MLFIDVSYLKFSANSDYVNTKTFSFVVIIIVILLTITAKIAQL